MKIFKLNMESIQVSRQINRINYHQPSIDQEVISCPVRLKDAKKWQRIYSTKL
jgi:hypothetical protein